MELQSSLADQPHQGKEGQFTVSDFQTFWVKDGGLAILLGGKARGLSFDKQASRLPDGFRPISFEEVSDFLAGYQEKNGCYPDVGQIMVWTSDTQGNNRIAAVINSCFQTVTANPLHAQAVSAYTGAPIVIAAFFG